MDINHIKDIVKNNYDEILQKGRNVIVRHILNNGEEIVIKSFKIPNFINKIIYRFFRKSKAKIYLGFNFCIRLIFNYLYGSN